MLLGSVSQCTTQCLVWDLLCGYSVIELRITVVSCLGSGLPMQLGDDPRSSYPTLCISFLHLPALSSLHDTFQLLGVPAWSFGQKAGVLLPLLGHTLHMTMSVSEAKW